MICKIRTLVLIIILLLLIPVNSFAYSDFEEFAVHFGLSAIFGASGESILHYKTELGTAKRIIYGTIIGSVPGLAKEIVDSTEEDNHFSGKQMAQNVAGAFFGSVIANFINNKIQIKIENQKKKTMLSISYRF
jgi:uncharacterized protein YfiM (DUF2279 family)